MSIASHTRTPLTAADARCLIRHLIDPNQVLSLKKSCAADQRQLILLYTLKKLGFQASGVKCMVQFDDPSYLLANQAIFTDVYAIAIREGGVEEMFSLHKKTKVSLGQEDDVLAQVHKGVNALSTLRGRPGVKGVFWEETHPEPMKPRDIRAETELALALWNELARGMMVLSKAWILDRETVSSHAPRRHVRL